MSEEELGEIPLTQGYEDRIPNIQGEGKSVREEKRAYL